MNATPVEYDHNGNTVAGWIIDSMESPLTGKLRFLVADSPNDCPTVDGKWVDAIDCEEPEEPGFRNGQCLSQFI
jgi:hypothetical protein